MPPLTITRQRLERLVADRAREQEAFEHLNQVAENEQRPLNDAEREMRDAITKRMDDLDSEMHILGDEVERENGSRDYSALLRDDTPHVPAVRVGEPGGVAVYRTFAEYARDQLIVRYDSIAQRAAGEYGDVSALRANVQERLERVEHTLTSDVAGLLPPTHMAQIMDIINTTRPVVATARHVDLSSGKLTYPKIEQRPEVLKQTVEKTEAGTANMQVTLEDLTADVYLGGGNLSWQTINWSRPPALQLWFDLAAEAYARQTETAACAELQTAAGGTASPALGTTGTEDFAAWRNAVNKGWVTVYNATGGRARTNTLYVSATRFAQIANLSSPNSVQLSAVGQVNMETMTGSFNGLRVVGSYGFSNANTAILGDGAAFLVGETPGAPVEMRAVEPAIGGMEVGLIGAFKSKVFDADRFIHLT